MRAHGSGRVRRAWRVLRRAVRVAAAVMAGLLLLLAVAAALPSVRGALLRRGLDAAATAAPGRLTVDAAAWPRPGRLELRGIVWRTATGDTLAVVPRVDCALDLGALLARDLVVDTLTVRVRRVDVPAVRTLLAAVPPDTAAPPAAADAAATAVPFLREGPRPGLPSLALHRLDLAVASLRAAPGLLVADLRLAGGVDARHGRTAVDGRIDGGLAARVVGAPAGRWSGVLAPDADGGRRLTARVGLEGSAATGGDLTAAADVAVTAGAGAGRLRLRAGVTVPPDGITAVRARLDTLDLHLAGLHVAARGSLDSVAVALAATLAADADSLAPSLPAGGPEVSGSASLRVDLEAPRPDLAAPSAAWPVAGLRVRVSGGAEARRVAVPALPWQAGPSPPRTVSARFEVAADGTDGGEVDTRADLRLTARDGRERVRLRGGARVDPRDPRAAVVRLDSLRLTLPHLGLTASGGVSPEGVRLVADLTAAGPLLAPAAAAAGARTEDARADVRLDLAAPTPPWDTPIAAWPVRDARLRLTVRGALPLAAWPPAPWQAALPGWREQRLDARLDLEAAGRADGRVAAELAADLRADGGDARVRLRAASSVDPGAPAAAVVRLDTLAVDLAGLALRARGALADTALDLTADLAVASPLPLLAAVAPASADAELAADVHVALEGSRRRPRVRLEGTARYRDDRQRVDGLRVVAAGGLDSLAARVATGAVVRDGRTWADSLEAAFAFRPANPLPLAATVAATRGEDRLSIGAAAGTDSVVTVRLDTLAVVLAGQALRLAGPVRAHLDTAGRGYRMDRFVLVGDPGRLELVGSARDGALDLHAAADLRLPRAVMRRLEELGAPSLDAGVALAGTVDLQGTVRRPEVDGDLNLSLAGADRRPAVGLAARVTGGRDEAPTAALRLAVADTVRFRGTAAWDGRLEEGVSPWTPVPVGSVVVRVPEQSLRLGVLAGLLPPGVGAQGVLALAADARLPVGPGDVEGRLEATVASRGVEVALPNRSRVSLELDTRLEGTPRDPRVAGTVTVRRGFLRIPEFPRNLLPAEGTAELWQVANAAAEPGAGSVAPAAWAPDTTVAAPATPLPDLDLVIDMPGGLQVHGYGLSAELGGHLKVTRGSDARGRPGPSLHGEVEVLRGTLRFMNRMFEIRRGRVVFGGQVPPNPRLDLVLDTEVAGNVIIIAVSGEADDPVVDLSARPERDRADIMGLLLFGRPLNDLDSDQRGRVRQEEDPGQQLRENLAGLALAFGTRDLQDSVSNTFGVDIVEFGTDSSGGSTVAAGRYLNPRLLLKYHQSLEKSGTYFMTLEYSLGRALRLISTYGQGNEASGLELSWLRRY